MFNNWQVDSVDVEATILNATLDKEVFLELPEGFFGGDTSGDKILHGFEI